jgi:hypothetical protein
MDKNVFERADKLNQFLTAYKETVNLYCNYSNGCNYNDMSYVLRDIDAINPELSKDIKKAVQKAFNSIQKEFDEL